MGEREKMLAGQWYDANNDQALIAERLAAAQVAYDFNQARPGSPEQASALRHLLRDGLGEGCEVLAPLYVDYGSNITLGEGTFVNHGCYFMDGAPITLGSHVFVGPFCGFYTASHPLEAKARNAGLEKASPISVGDNCWFGANVSVMPGVTIGCGCVIAAGSVVTRDLPDNSLAAGVPAKIKRTIDQGKGSEQQE